MENSVTIQLFLIQSCQPHVSFCQKKKEKDKRDKGRKMGIPYEFRVEWEVHYLDAIFSAITDTQMNRERGKARWED